MENLETCLMGMQSFNELVASENFMSLFTLLNGASHKFACQDKTRADSRQDCIT